MDARTELHGVVISTSDSERYFGTAPLWEIRRELTRYGVNVEEITASLRTYLARRTAQLAPPRERFQREQAEALYLEGLQSIDRIAAFVARRAHLNTDEAEEFTAEVRIRLLENDYAIIRKFEGRQSFATYLTTVILRLCHQYRVEQRGKWRPSAEATRIGETAITLERLLNRDGLSFEEAVNTLTMCHDSPSTRLELEAIHARLPVRNPRPRFVAEDIPIDVPAMDSADDRVQERDRTLNARSAAAALDAVMQQLSAEDRAILQMRFWQGMKVSDIARALDIEQKKLYKRLVKLLTVLRGSLENAGIDRNIAGDLLGHPASDFPLESMPERMQTASDVKRPV